jgi:segregation and condensation protein B
MELLDIARVLEIDGDELGHIADELIQQKINEHAGILITKIDGKMQLCSNPQFAPYVEKALQPVKKTKLSQSLLETLAIVAYRQPVTRFEIEQVRGVKCNYSIAALIENRLVTRAGRKKTLGNPMVYITSDDFLRHFGISSLNELPTVKTD